VAKVLVLGNAGLDISLQMPRLPERGETLLGDGAMRAPGGKGLNQAVVAARAGADTRFAAPIGNDGMGEEIVRILCAEQNLVFEPQRLEGSSDFSLLMVLPDGENSIVTAGACAAAFSPEDAARFAAKAEAGDLFLAQGNLAQETTLAGFKAARDRGAFTVFNPAPIWWDAGPLLAHCDILVVNRGEAEAISGLDYPAAAAARLHERGAKTTIITLGGDGCLVHSNGTARHHEAVAVEVRDTTGCGDTFCGALCAALSLGRSLEEAIAHAQSAASVTATRPGAFRALPSPAELSALCKTEA
jgi:ribokinase